MKRFYLAIAMIFVGVSVLWSQHANVVWDTPSRNSSESMPCGGGDIGMNIWVEEGDILFYLSRSGTFDENNCQLKQGRFRLRLSPNPFEAPTPTTARPWPSSGRTDRVQSIFRQRASLAVQRPRCSAQRTRGEEL